VTMPERGAFALWGRFWGGRGGWGKKTASVGCPIKREREELSMRKRQRAQKKRKRLLSHGQKGEGRQSSEFRCLGVPNCARKGGTSLVFVRGRKKGGVRTRAGRPRRKSTKKGKGKGSTQSVETVLSSARWEKKGEEKGNRSRWARK